MMIERARIIAAAKTLEGVPFMHQGRNPKLGLDCGGIIETVARLVGIDFVPSVSDYQERPPHGLLESCISKLCTRVDTPSPADIVLFRILRRVQHSGIMTRDGWMITVSSRRFGAGKVVERPIGANLLKCLECGYRFPGVEA
jgi:cell wall-associated NlpC family hydrolase